MWDFSFALFATELYEAFGKLAAVPGTSERRDPQQIQCGVSALVPAPG